MKIGEKTISLISERVESLVREYLSEINDAYFKFGEDDPDFKVAFKATFKPASSGDTKVIVDISFPPGPNIKGSSAGFVNEDQQDLPFKEEKPVEWEYPYCRPDGPKGPPEKGYPVWRRIKQ